MIRDDVYNKLPKIKGNKSFSDIIEELIEESISLRRKKIEEYFGILKEEEAEELKKGNLRNEEKFTLKFYMKFYLTAKNKTITIIVLE
jgi:predicted CopG family antitoxin